MIPIDKFTELAHSTASRYSHRSEPARVFYTFTADTLADFHRQVCAEAAQAVKQLFPQPHCEYFGREVVDAIESLKGTP